MTKKIAVLSAQERQDTFGTFAYDELSGGRIQIDPRWVEQNMVECHLAKASGQGKDVVTRCHRLVKEPIERAFEEIAARGLWRLIHSFDGLWVPRHMTWNAGRPLSSHSWGIAFDLNASRNPYGGGVTPENRSLNEVFNRYGFAWGGDWNTSKDAMHWELADIQAWKSQLSAPASLQLPSPRLILAVARDGGFSYHAMPNARLSASHFEVEPQDVAHALGLPIPAPGAGAQELRVVLSGLHVRVIRLGNHLSDLKDPRYYVFLRLPDPTGQASATASTSASATASATN